MTRRRLATVENLHEDIQEPKEEEKKKKERRKKEKAKEEGVQATAPRLSTYYTSTVDLLFQRRIDETR